MTTLANLLSINKSFSKEELVIIESKFHSITIKKNDFLLKQGAICNEVALVVEGSFVLTQATESGSTIVLDFFMGGDLVCDYYSYLKSSPAITDIKALQNSSLLTIKRQEIDFLLDSIPNFQQFSRQLAEQSFVRLAERLKQNGLSTSAKYASLLQNKPEVIQQFPQYLIASYLGVSPEWLSKQRAKP